jgi:hypothetical protein
MNNFQVDSIQSFGFSIGMARDNMSTIDRGMFDDVFPAMQIISKDTDTSQRQNKKPAKKSTTKRPAAKKTTVPKQKIPSSSSLKKRSSKPRRALPETKTYIEESEPKDSDVISGRGGRSNRHPGNKACWLVMLSHREAYRHCTTDEEKKKIAQGVVDFVSLQNGRYVQLDAERERWFVLPNGVALEKAKQGLRDKHVPRWVTGEAAGGKKKSPVKKHQASKKQQAETPSCENKPEEAEPTEQAQEENVDEFTAAISTRFSAGFSFDGLLSLASISNSLIGVDSFCGVKSLLRSGDKSLEMSWVVEPTTQTKGDWDAMFATGISSTMAAV